MLIYHNLIIFYFIARIKSLTLFPNNQVCKISDVNITDEHVQLNFQKNCNGLEFTNVNFKTIPLDILIDNPYAYMIRLKECLFQTAVDFYDMPRVSILDELHFESGEIEFSKKCFANCTNLKVLTFKNVTFKFIDRTLFNDINYLDSIQVRNMRISNEFIQALSSIKMIKHFECKNCGISDLRILEAFNSIGHIVITSNPIEHFNCSSIQHLKKIERTQPISREPNRQKLSRDQKTQLAILNMILNKLTGVFETCQIENVEIKFNQITTLFVRNRTLIVDATGNFISSVKCDDEMDIKQLILTNNSLTDLMCISTMTTLQILYIDSNNFKFFRADGFLNLNNLTTISALDNPLTYYDPKMFISSERGNLIGIRVARFDYGYDEIRNFYPSLKELIHGTLNQSCVQYENIFQILKIQNIRFFYENSYNCNVF